MKFDDLEVMPWQNIIIYSSFYTSLSNNYNVANTFKFISLSKSQKLMSDENSISRRYMSKMLPSFYKAI